jgi:hypothetical protein
MGYSHKVGRCRFLLCGKKLAEIYRHIRRLPGDTVLDVNDAHQYQFAT